MLLLRCQGCLFRLARSFLVHPSAVKCFLNDSSNGLLAALRDCPRALVFEIFGWDCDPRFRFRVGLVAGGCPVAATASGVARASLPSFCFEAVASAAPRRCCCSPALGLGGLLSMGPPFIGGTGAVSSAASALESTACHCCEAG